MEEEPILPPKVEEEVTVVSSSDNDLEEDNWQFVDSLVVHNNVESSNEVYPKYFPPQYKDKYKDKEFDYSLNKPQKSFFERLKDRVIVFIESILGEINPHYNFDFLITIIKVVGILIGVFLLYFILMFFFDKKRRSIFGKKNAKLDIEAEELHENIHEINFPEMILNFESKKDFRSAVRYQFLFLLKKLNTKNLIVWNPEKTNRDYELEIKKELQAQYSRWSFIFEYVWYGEFEINQDQYQKFKNEFETAKF